MKKLALILLALLAVASSVLAARKLKEPDAGQAKKDLVYDLARLGIDPNTAKVGTKDQAELQELATIDHRLDRDTDEPEVFEDFPDDNQDDEAYYYNDNDGEQQTTGGGGANNNPQVAETEERSDDVMTSGVIEHRMVKDQKDSSALGGIKNKIVSIAEKRRQALEEKNKARAQQQQQQQQRVVTSSHQVAHHLEEEIKNAPDAFAAGVLKEKRLWRNARPAISGADAAVRAQQLPNHIPVITVVAMTIAMASAAGLGALPFFFVRQLSSHWSAISTAIACGVMFAASFDLIHEGQPYGPHLVVFGVLLGGLFIRYMQKILDGMEDVQFGHLHGNRARRLVLMVGIMAAHAIGEGCGVGVSFCGDRGWAQGVLTTLAIGVHNVPEGLAKATVLVSQGASAYEALFWSVVTCLPQPLVAVPSFIFVETFTMLLPTALGFAAGCMIWMVFAELLPDALEGAKSSEVASAATLSAAGLEGIRMMFEALEGPAGAFLSPFSSTGKWASFIPAIGEVTPGVAAIAIAAGVVGGSALPAPVVLCFSAVSLAFTGLAPVVNQVTSVDIVPPSHTVSAVIFGMAGILIIRRYLLRTLTGEKSTNDSHFRGGVGAASKYSSSGADIHAHDSGEYDARENGNGHASGYGGSTGQQRMHYRKADGYPMPDSPSKSKGAKGGGFFGGGGGSRGGDDNSRGFNKAPGRLAAPAQAAGLAVAVALLLKSIPVGWHFTRQALEVELGALTMVPAMAATLALHGIAIGGATRAIMGRSAAIGAAAGLLLGGVTAASMLVPYFMSSSNSTQLLNGLTYPEGWTETLTAVAGGALCISALFLVAIAMHMSSRHARFGLLLGVLCLGGAAGLVGVGCVGAENETSCAIIETFLL